MDNNILQALTSDESNKNSIINNTNELLKKRYEGYLTEEELIQRAMTVSSISDILQPPKVNIIKPSKHWWETTLYQYLCPLCNKETNLHSWYRGCASDSYYTLDYFKCSCGYEYSRKH